MTSNSYTGAMAPVRRVIHLWGWPPSPFDIERYGLKTIQARGLAAEGFDLSPLVNPAAVPPALSPEDASFVRRIRSHAELDQALADTSPDSAYVDGLIGIGNLDLKNERVFRLLRRHQCRLMLVAAGALPVMAADLKPATRLARRLRQVADPNTLGRFAATRLISALKKSTSLYPRPALLFGGQSEAVAAYARRLAMPPESVVAIHSLDYDRYLDYRRTHPSPPAPQKTCVFLDEAATHHPDFAILGERPLDEEPYFREMRAFFDAIEAATGLKVVIAAHPRSDYGSRPGAFGDRAIVKDRTLDLVAESSLVVAHATTSVAFAVLFQKPVRFLLTSQMERTRVEEGSRGIGRALGVIPVTLPELTAGYDWNSISEDAYESYRYRYIQSRGVPDKTVWEIVADRAQAL